MSSAYKYDNGCKGGGDNKQHNGGMMVGIFIVRNIYVASNCGNDFYWCLSLG